MEIYLIRHTTPEIISGQIYGWLDVPLQSGYQDEINTVKKELPERLDVVYSSPSTRCQIMAGELHSKYIVDERLRELHFGAWEGMTWNTVDQVALQLWMDDFVNVCIPGGESLQLMKERLISFWNELIDGSYEKVAVVTHAGVIRILMALQEGNDMTDIFKLKVDYGEVFCIKASFPYKSRP